MATKFRKFGAVDLSTPQSFPQTYSTTLQVRYDTVMTDNIPEESPVSVPENLSASIILSTLPRDATTALTQASTPSKTKRLPSLLDNV
jgi:hypothetical protein